MIERYVWRGGRFVDKRTGAPMRIRDSNAICMPRVMSDVAAYASPIDGRLIDGRREQREDLKRNDCVISDFPRKKFDPEEYRCRKAQQAKALEGRKGRPSSE